MVINQKLYPVSAPKSEPVLDASLYKVPLPRCCTRCTRCPWQGVVQGVQGAPDPPPKTIHHYRAELRLPTSRNYCCPPYLPQTISSPANFKKSSKQIKIDKIDCRNTCQPYMMWPNYIQLVWHYKLVPDNCDAKPSAGPEQEKGFENDEKWSKKVKTLGANRAVKEWMKTSRLRSKSLFPPICEKPMKAFWSDDCLPNQSNHHQTEIPSEPEKSQSSDSFPSFGSKPRTPWCHQYIIRAPEWALNNARAHVC